MRVATRQADPAIEHVLLWPGRHCSNMVQSWGLVQQSWLYPTVKPSVCVSALKLLWRYFPDFDENQKK